MIEILRAQPADAACLAQLRRSVWLETYRGIYPDAMLDEYDLEFYTQRDRERMEQPNQFYYFFTDKGAPIGYFSFGPYHYGQYKDFEICLNNLYILAEYKGIGLGRQAFGLIRQHCLQHGVHKFFCGCNANNLPAIAFYRHMGGQQGSDYDPTLPKEDQIIHFEFYIGE